MIRAKVERILTPAQRWAVGFGLLAVGCVVVWLATDAADAWMPNAATGAVTIGLTITLVEWILQREEARRMRPWVESVTGQLHSELWFLVQRLLYAYAATHVEDEYKEPPRGLLEFFRFYDLGVRTTNV